MLPYLEVSWHFKVVQICFSSQGHLPLMHILQIRAGWCHVGVHKQKPPLELIVQAFDFTYGHLVKLDAKDRVL